MKTKIVTHSMKIILLLNFILTLSAHADEVKDIRYISSGDGSEQPTLFYAPVGSKKIPLMVALHTWSGGYKQNYYKYIETWCVKNGWAYIHPHFRGPNKSPEATGSKLVVADILSAVEYAKNNASIDSSAIFLVGVSGGGYTALLMAGRHPEIWAGVSAWVPISDLKAWHKQGRYVKYLELSCGGAPGQSAQVDQEYTDRSPLTYLKNAIGVKMHINAGIYDGHKGSVPISHSLLAFNEVAAPEDRISENDVEYFVKEAKVPPALKTALSDSSYGDKRPLFRKTSGHATLTIFDGKHEIVQPAAIAWIQQIYNQEHEHANVGVPMLEQALEVEQGEDMQDVRVEGGPSWPGNKHLPEKIVDRKEETYWAGDPKSSAWELVLSFSEETDIQKVKVIYYSKKHLPEEALVFISDDKENWNKIASLPETETAKLDIGNACHYIKIVFSRKTGGKQVAIREIYITKNKSEVHK